MKDDIRTRIMNETNHVFLLSQVAVDTLHARKNIIEPRDIGRFPGENGDVVTEIHEPPHEVRPDKPMPAGNTDLHTVILKDGGIRGLEIPTPLRLHLRPMSDTQDTPTVSVVMPVYNGARFIRRTIDSVLAQTFTNFECIIVDDGSTDGTQDILREYADKDPRIIVHLAQHAGKVSAFNAGFAQARGEFIAIHCADDISFPERFETEIQFLNDHPSVAAVGAWVDLIDADGKVTGVIKHVTEPYFIDWRLYFRNPLADSTVMLRKSVMEEFGWYKETGSEDYELLSRISPTYDVANIPRILGQYRIWQGNFTSLHGAKEEETVYMVIRERTSALLHEHVSENEARALRLPIAKGIPMGRTDIRQAASLLSRLLRAFLSSKPLTGEQKQTIRDDASEYLFRLSDAAAGTSPGLYVLYRLKAVLQNPLFLLHAFRQRSGS